MIVQGRLTIAILTLLSQQRGGADGRNGDAGHARYGHPAAKAEARQQDCAGKASSPGISIGIGEDATE
jgi:hypothetical protein